jgi:hypothetical protein
MGALAFLSPFRPFLALLDLSRLRTRRMANDGLGSAASPLREPQTNFPLLVQKLKTLFSLSRIPTADHQ